MAPKKPNIKKYLTENMVFMDKYLIELHIPKQATKYGFSQINSPILARLEVWEATRTYKNNYYY